MVLLQTLTRRSLDILEMIAATRSLQLKVQSCTPCDFSRLVAIDNFARDDALRGLGGGKYPRREIFNYQGINMTVYNTKIVGFRDSVSVNQNTYLGCSEN